LSKRRIQNIIRLLFVLAIAAQADILAVKEKHEPQLLAISGVVTDRIKQAVPKTLEGYPVTIEAIGAVRAQ